MDRILRDFLSVLKGFIHATKPEITEPADWDGLFRLGDMNGVSGIIGYMILKYQLTQDERIVETAKERATNSAGMSIRRFEQANRLIRKLNENGIEHLVMKGYLVRNCYSDPRLRTFGDIDLLIHQEDRSAIDELMSLNGYRTAKNWEPVYVYRKDTEFYEFHSQIFDAQINDRTDYIGYFSNAWDHAVLLHDKTYQFTPEYHLLYLAAHLAKHIYVGGAGIRMYMDIALFLLKYKDTFNWQMFSEYISDLKFERFMDYLWHALDSWFDVKLYVYDPIEKDIMEEMLNTTVYGGTFGFNNTNAASRSLRKNPGSADSRFSTVRRIAFPSVALMKSRYTYLNDKPWLLPAAWIHRLFVNKKKIGHEQKMIKEIMTTDRDEINRHKKYREKIGL